MWTVIAESDIATVPRLFGPKELDRDIETFLPCTCSYAKSGSYAG